MWKQSLAALLGVVVVFVVWDDFDPEIIKNKRVVITGASSGIGEQLAYEYAKLGAKVIITSRRSSSLEKVIARCREVGRADGEYYYIAGDMLDLSFTSKVIAEANTRLGEIDYLVLNHLVIYPMLPWRGSNDNLTLLTKVMTGNFESYVHLTSHALGTLTKSRGSIVVVSSIAGKLGQELSIVYSASKFALDGFFSGLREEMKLQGKDDISITLCVIGVNNETRSDYSLGDCVRFSVTTSVKGIADRRRLPVVEKLKKRVQDNEIDDNFFKAFLHITWDSSQLHIAFRYFDSILLLSIMPRLTEVQRGRAIVLTMQGQSEVQIVRHFRDHVSTIEFVSDVWETLDGLTTVLDRGAHA